ncbi:hypothetical protein HWV62_19337 [Athelia sp. TMB]|nr:hypothetical protein HWV62_19337 [Athelia sp. TMB]
MPVAQECLAKQEKKKARALSQDAKAQCFKALTETASAQDTSYSTPLVEKDKKCMAPPLRRTESVALEELFEKAANEMDTNMPPPLPPVLQRKRKSTKANDALNKPPAEPDVATVKRNTNAAPPKTKDDHVKDGAIAPTSQRGHASGDPNKADKTTTVALKASKPQSSQVKSTLVPAKPNPCSGDVAPTLPDGSKGQPIGYRPRPSKRATATSNVGLGPDDQMDIDVDININTYRALPARPAAAPASRTRATRTTAANSTSKQAKATAQTGYRAVQAPTPISQDAEESSVTEDDSQAPEYVSKALSETEDSDKPPPTKKTKTGGSDAQLKTKQKGAGGGKHPKGRVIVDEESSDVEVVEESNIRVTKVQAPTVKNLKHAVGAASKERSSHQMPAQDKIKSNSNAYRKPNFSGTNGVEMWTANLPQGIKVPSQRTTSTPSLTNSRSNVSQATTATRPPASVTSRTSALNNGIKISEEDDGHFNERGAISDRDETKGEEFEAKKSSPVKDGRRLNSEHKIKVEPGLTAPIPVQSIASSRSTQKLPEHFQEGNIWKNKVIPSIIMVAATQPRIFRIPLKKLAQLLGVVARFHYDDDSIEFDAKDPVVAKVAQRLADQFRSPIGSAAIAVLLAYLASDSELRDSDDKRAEWCEMMLQDYRFIYGAANDVSPKRWKCPFQAGLIVQTFAAYISAIKNVPWLEGMYPGSDNPDTPRPEPRPALALVAAAVERALRYVADGRITLATIEDSEKPGGHLIIADVSPTTGRRSAPSVAFSEELWGDSVDDYLNTISRLRKSDMDKIIIAARRFSRITRSHEEDDGPVQRVHKSSRARIPLNYDDDDDELEDLDESNVKQVDVNDDDEPAEEVDDGEFAEQGDDDEPIEQGDDDKIFEQDDDNEIFEQASNTGKGQPSYGDYNDGMDYDDGANYSGHDDEMDEEEG